LCERSYAPGQSCQYPAFPWLQESGINPYIWCVVGAVLGGIAGLLVKSGDRIVLIENIGVGIFGAYIGGDFVAAMLNHGVAEKEFTAGSLGLSVAGALVSLGLLRLMQRAVGPMKNSKAKRRRD
jgi:uncharacterized membrane protein YeaQ/YmgE (transglycosylase-associated protein family)